jgi:hypothetical protein
MYHPIFAVAIKTSNPSLSFSADKEEMRSLVKKNGHLSLDDFHREQVEYQTKFTFPHHQFSRGCP